MFWDFLETLTGIDIDGNGNIGAEPEPDIADSFAPPDDSVDAYYHQNEDVYYSPDLNAVVKEYDTFEEGGGNTHVFEVDYDNDGVSDEAYYFFDHDGDGTYDSSAMAVPTDIDGDGVFDGLVVYTDNDIDGQIDVAALIVDGQIVETRDFTQDVITAQNEYVQPEGDESGVSADYYLHNTDYDYFDPATANPDDIIGDPASAMVAYHVQDRDMGGCAVVAQEFILQQLTGVDYTEAQLRDYAEAMGWYTPGGGTPPNDVGNILVEMGLNVTTIPHGTIDDIANTLANGGAVIVGVDIYDIYGAHNDGYAPGTDANHAVQVIGIDKSDPAHPMIILNDSGQPDGGCGIMVPYDDFMDGWVDSGCYMVEAFAPATMVA